MPIAWELRGTVLVVTEAGMVPNSEIEQTFLGEALFEVRSAGPARVLWDARGGRTPLSPDDIEWRTETLSSLASRGVVSRFALLLKAERQLTIQLARSEFAKVVAPLQFGVFTEESEALAWLRS